LFALAMHDGSADSVIPGVQNLMLAARALGIGSVPTTLHPTVMSRFHPAAGLADSIGEVPCIVFALALHHGPADSVIPAVQNLMLAARALGIASVPTTLHPSVMPRFHAMFGIPDDVGFHFCVPLGYPQGRFGPTNRKPTSDTTFLNRWDSPVPWT